jgi:CheY-like chemotaxis protein
VAVPSTGHSAATVLIVEDDRDSREMLCTWLQQHGYRTLAAADGEEGLRHLDETEDLSLILLDLMMPGMTGWEFRASQRTHRRFRKVPVVIMTAHPNPAGESEWLDPEDVLLKPLDLHAVLHIVTRCCGPTSRTAPSQSGGSGLDTVEHPRKIP